MTMSPSVYHQSSIQSTTNVYPLHVSDSWSGPSMAERIATTWWFGSDRKFASKSAVSYASTSDVGRSAAFATTISPKIPHRTSPYITEQVYELRDPAATSKHSK